MRTHFSNKVFLVLWLVSTSAYAQSTVSAGALPAHPRILLLKGEEKGIHAAVANSAVWRRMHEAIIGESDKMIDLPLLERIQIGRRLLDKSRECIRRLFYLSYAYRMTGDGKYLKRAEREMLTVANFSDWNPTHFLDVAEMTLGMAIGYDWLYDQLSTGSRSIIREAILKKGIEPSLDERYNSWLRVTNNWNQVCNAGMSYGALAIASEYPELSRQIIERAITAVQLPMHDYQPDGAYPEGYTYWGYGTSFNVLFLSAMEKAFSSDFGLAGAPGFLKTAGFRQHMTGITGMPFNWGDCGTRGSLSPAMFWFAQKTNDPSLLWVEKTYLQDNDFSDFVRDRLLPAILIWGKDFALEKVRQPSSTFWLGQGSNPVCLMRTSWTDPGALYLGFKTGSASVNHGHMDIGSFVMESDGVRWAADFGMQDYESLESKGIKLFGRTQDAQRWSVFRLNNYVHNTLTVNEKLQQVKGYARIDRFSDKSPFSFATSDLSSVYEGQLASVKRGVALVKGKYVVVQDEIVAADTLTTIRWTMLTHADVDIDGKNSATLTQDGKKLILRVNSPEHVTMKTWSTDPATDYDAPNPGSTLVGFEVQLPPNKAATLNVQLLPAGAVPEAQHKVISLSQWR